MAGLRANATARTVEAAGTVRLAAPDTLTTHILLPSLRPLLDRYPALKLELVTGIATVGIARGEADLALRLVRPEQGALTVRQVGRLAHSLYAAPRSEEHTSELQSLMRISYAVFCLKNKNTNTNHNNI